MINRRAFLQAGIAGAVASRISPSVGQEFSSLGELAAQSGLAFGTAFPNSALGDPAYLALIAQQARVVTPENFLKFDYLNPRGEGIDFSGVDEMFDFAEGANAQIFAQPLFWNDYYPPWLNGLSIKELQRVFDEHIEAVVARYAGRMQSWGVVNEPFAPWGNLPHGFRDGPWYWAFGEGYVARAFRRVAALDPGAKLILNEAQCENDYKWGKAIRPQLLGLIDRMQDAGVPIHGVGLQGHLQPQWDFDYEQHGRFIEEIGARGLDVYITELDVNDMAFELDHPRRDAQSSDHLRQYLSHVLAQPAVKMLMVWNLADPYSWYRNLDQGWRRDARALIFDGEYQPKPAFYALEDALRARIRP